MKESESADLPTLVLVGTNENSMSSASGYDSSPEDGGQQGIGSSNDWLNDLEDLGVDLTPADLKVHLSEWKQKKLRPFVRHRDKFAFMLGVINAIAVTFFIGNHQYVLPFIYTVKAPILVLLRYFAYRAQSWHYFLLDFCYYANGLLLVFLWAFRHEPRVFIVLYSVVWGPLFWAIPLFRNSLVFHSLDKITSVFIHLGPLVVTFVCRWELDQSQHPDYFEVSTCLDDSCPFRWTYGFLYPLAFFAGHQIIWFFLVHVVWRSDFENNPNALNTFRYLTSSERGLTFNLSNLLGPKFRRPLFSFWYVVFAAITILPTRLYYTYYGLNIAMLLYAFLVTVWNGASWYMDVFRATNRRSSVVGANERKRHQNEKTAATVLESAAASGAPPVPRASDKK